MGELDREYLESSPARQGLDYEDAYVHFSCFY